MSLDTLEPSPRRMQRTLPPPVPPKRFLVKDFLQDAPLLTSSSPEGRKQSAVERLAADKAKYVKSQPVVCSKPQPIKAVPVKRRQLVQPTSSSSVPSRPSPQRPMRKIATTPRPHSEGRLLDLQHLTNLISGMGEPPPPPASQTTASSSSQSSEGGGGGGGGGGGDENCNEAAAPIDATPTAPADKLPPAPTASPAPSAHIPPASAFASPCSPSLRAVAEASGSQASGSQGCPAVAVRRVDVRPQVVPVRKAMRVPLQSRMPAQMLMPKAAQAKLQQQAQSQAHLMYLLKAQMASKNAALAPKNAPLLPLAKLPLSATQAGVTAQKVPINPSQPCLPPNQNPDGYPASVSPRVPSPLQPVSVTPPSSSTSPTTLPQSATSSTAKPAGPPGAPTPATPLSALLQGGSSSPAPSPSPCPSLTRHSSTSSRKRPSLSRSKSDMSDRFSRAGADLERFFNYCGLDPADLEELAQPGSDIASVSRLRSASAPASECSQDQANEEEEQGDGDEEAQRNQRTPYGISVIERNARVIKWLYGLRQARDPARVANI